MCTTIFNKTSHVRMHFVTTSIGFLSVDSSNSNIRKYYYDSGPIKRGLYTNVNDNYLRNYYFVLVKINYVSLTNDLLVVYLSGCSKAWS